MARTPVFCKDCKFYDHITFGDYCTHNYSKNYNLITGEHTYKFCNTMRSDPYSCGYDASLFQSKIIEDADLDDLSTIPFGR